MYAGEAFSSWQECTIFWPTRYQQRDGTLRRACLMETVMGRRDERGVWRYRELTEEDEQHDLERRAW